MIASPVNVSCHGARPRLTSCTRPPLAHTITTASSASHRARVLAVHATETEAAPSTTDKCQTCGVERSKIPGGCDGEGRIIGGLGGVPGFGWWPIKAYRPCPAASEAGIDYVRKGQATNEVLFGGVSLGPDASRTLTEMRRQADRGLDVEVGAQGKRKDDKESKQ